MPVFYKTSAWNEQILRIVQGNVNIFFLISHSNLVTQSCKFSSGNDGELDDSTSSSATGREMGHLCHLYPDTAKNATKLTLTNPKPNPFPVVWRKSFVSSLSWHLARSPPLSGFGGEARAPFPNRGILLSLTRNQEYLVSINWTFWLNFMILGTRGTSLSSNSSYCFKLVRS